MVARSLVLAAPQQLAQRSVEQVCVEPVEAPAPPPAAVGAEETAPGTTLPPMDRLERETAMHDAPVVLPNAKHGRYMGLTLYCPALAAIGLLSEASWDSWRLLFLEKMEPWQTTNNPRNAGTRRSFGSGPSGWCSKPTSRAVSASA